MLDEPPGVDPHAGWCGGWGETPGYPIMCGMIGDRDRTQIAPDNV